MSRSPHTHLSNPIMEDIQRINAITNMQSSRDLRNLPINQVGIKDLRFLISLKSKEGRQSTVARLTITAFLSANRKGTHMLRFIALMEKQTDALDFDTLHKLTADMAALLDSHSGRISMSFPFPRKKDVSISGIQSLFDCDVTLTDEIKNGTYSYSLKVMVPATSLCPCSKGIFQCGTHNQRLHITVNLITNADIGIEEIIGYVEAQVSCQLYGLLRHPDEKYVAEKAYENPKFVEDMVRDVATVLIADKHIESFVVESGNPESIHNHSAYVYIVCP